MAKYRETPCKYYVAFHNCTKGREACQSGYCQHCSKYEPRARVRHMNKKKQYLDLLNIAPSRPVFIWGAPGIGKSALVEQFAKDLGLPCVSLLGSQLAPEDIIGIPQIKGENASDTCDMIGIEVPLQYKTGESNPYVETFSAAMTHSIKRISLDDFFKNSLRKGLDYPVSHSRGSICPDHLL